MILSTRRFCMPPILPMIRVLIPESSADIRPTLIVRAVQSESFNNTGVTPDGIIQFALVAVGTNTVRLVAAHILTCGVRCALKPSWIT